jgi:hypothetical protein
MDAVGADKSNVQHELQGQRTGCHDAAPNQNGAVGHARALYESYTCARHGDTDIHAMTDDTPDGAKTNALKNQLSEAVTRSGIEQDKVRALVCALVDQMKSEGAEPEKVVIAVKSAVLSETTVKAASDPANLKETEKMLQRALTWCIEQYYGE